MSRYGLSTLVPTFTPSPPMQLHSAMSTTLGVFGHCHFGHGGRHQCLPLWALMVAPLAEQITLTVVP
jgi:hypothetical protein